MTAVTGAGQTTLRELERSGAARLAGVSDTPALDSAVLLSAATGLDRATLLAWPERAPPAAAVRRFQALIAARATGRPIAYLTGEREFWSLRLAVSPAVLVPRPETELLVAAVLERLAAGATVLDLGTGSGAIALALARERAEARVWAADVSPQALAVARRNARRHRLPVRLVASDWGSAFAGGRFDCVVSNPPYVAREELGRDPALAHEPRIALDGGDDGLSALRRVVPDARRLLRRGGLLALEHGHRQAAAVRALLAAGGWGQVTTLTDLAGHPRVTLARAR